MFICATQFSANVIMDFLNEFHAHLMLQVGVIWASGTVGYVVFLLYGLVILVDVRCCGCRICL